MTIQDVNIDMKQGCQISEKENKEQKLSAFFACCCGYHLAHMSHLVHNNEQLLRTTWSQWGSAI